MLAYIPARGGSKRVPRKNIRPLAGVPILAHVVRKLRELPFISEIFVSTDDPEIAELAKKAGARWIGMRPAKLSDDKAGFIDLIHDDIPRHAAESASPTDDVLFVLPTAALIDPPVYLAAHDVWLRSRPDVLMSCVQYRKSPYWALVPGDDGFLKPLFAKWVYVNSQDLPPAYTDAGMFYMFDWRNMVRFDSHKNVDRLMPFIVDDLVAIDIDTPADWDELEQRVQRLLRAGT